RRALQQHPAARTTPVSPLPILGEGLGVRAVQPYHHGGAMPTATEHWSREPGRWEPALSPEAYATVPTITTPRPSPDGRRVAYGPEREERVDVVVAGLDGRWSRIISEGDEYVLQPRWSPDGARVLYGQWPHYDMPWDERALVVADADGGEPRVIAG